jgi:branched-chain amino acid transport system substrate-binding protein
MRWHKLATPFLITGLVLGSGALGASAAGAAGVGSKTVNVGVIEDLTGAASFCGIDELKGMQLAVKQAKAQGVNVHLEVKDDASLSSQAVVDFHSLADAGVSAILGSCFGTPNEAMYTLANSQHIPQILGTGDPPAYTDTPWVYGAAINSTTYVADPVPILAKQGIKSIATIYESDNPSTTVDYQTQAAAEKKAGIKQVGVYPLPSTTTDFSPEISEIKALHPDAISFLFVGTPNVTVVTQLRQAGLTVPILGQVVMQTPFYVQDAKAAANGSIFATDFASTFPFPSTKAFTKAWAKAEGTLPFYASATGFDEAEYLIQGIKKAKSTTPAGIRAGLNLVKGFAGAQGVLTASKSGVLLGSGGVVEIKNQKLTYLPPVKGS